MKHACLYSIARFAPHIDTGEFANIGVILVAPAVGQMQFRLTRRNSKRINGFFGRLTQLGAVLEALRHELTLSQQLTRTAAENQILAHFHYLTEPRDNIIQFSPLRPILCNALEACLEELFTRFVTQDEVHREVRSEEAITREIRQMFQQADISGFREQVLEGELTHLRLPLVCQKPQQTAAIKPLAFEQQEPAQILDHCEQWAARFRRAEEDGVIRLQDVLIPIYLPPASDNRQQKAMDRTRLTLQELGMQVVDSDDSQQIARFARSY